MERLKFERLGVRCDYSEQWRQTVAAYEKYRERLFAFNQLDEASIVNNLSKALHDHEDMFMQHAALKTLLNEYVADKVKIKLLDDLLFVFLRANVSSAALARAILIALSQTSEDEKRKFVKNRIEELIDQYSRDCKDVWELKDAADLLDELKYGEKLAAFADEHRESLIETEFAENDEDLTEIVNRALASERGEKA